MDSNNSEKKTEIIMTQNIFSTEEMVQASGVVKWWICVLTLHQSFLSSTFHRWTDHLSFFKWKIWHQKFQVACEKIHKTHKNKNPFCSSIELKVLPISSIKILLFSTGWLVCRKGSMGHRVRSWSNQPVSRPISQLSMHIEC